MHSERPWRLARTFRIGPSFVTADTLGVSAFLSPDREADTAATDNHQLIYEAGIVDQARQQISDVASRVLRSSITASSSVTKRPLKAEDEHDAKAHAAKEFEREAKPISVSIGSVLQTELRSRGFDLHNILSMYKVQRTLDYPSVLLIFNHYDADESGDLSFSEIRAFCSDIGMDVSRDDTLQTLTNMFRKADPDDDQKIRFVDFAPFAMQLLAIAIPTDAQALPSPAADVVVSDTSPYTWVRSRDQLPILEFNTNVKVYYAEGRRNNEFALQSLGAPHSGIIMRVKEHTNFTKKEHKRRMVFQFVPKHGFLAALIPSVTTEGLPTWRNHGIIAYANTINKQEWVKETYIAQMTGQQFNEYCEWLVKYGKKHNFYQIFDVWPTIQHPESAEVYHWSHTSDAFSQASVKELFRLGAEMWEKARPKRSYLPLIAWGPPEQVALEISWRSVLQFYARIWLLIGDGAVPDKREELLRMNPDGEHYAYFTEGDPLHGGTLYQVHLKDPYIGFTRECVYETMYLPFLTKPDDDEESDWNGDGINLTQLELIGRGVNDNANPGFLPFEEKACLGTWVDDDPKTGRFAWGAWGLRSPAPPNEPNDDQCQQLYDRKQECIAKNTGNALDGDDERICRRAHFLMIEGFLVGDLQEHWQRDRKKGVLCEKQGIPLHHYINTIPYRILVPKPDIYKTPIYIEQPREDKNTTKRVRLLRNQVLVQFTAKGGLPLVMDKDFCEHAYVDCKSDINVNTQLQTALKDMRAGAIPEFKEDTIL